MTRVRRATLADAGRLDDIERESFEAHAPGAMADELARSWSEVHVASDPSGSLVGYVVAWRVVDELEIIQVATEAGSRRRGHARALLDHVVAQARADRMVRITLEVRPSNAAAVTLYRSLGFTDMARRRRYYLDGEDALVMELKLG